MPSTNYLPLFSTLIPSCFAYSSNILEEKKAGMQLPFITTGTNSLTYQFDKDLDRSTYPKGLFPFFNMISGAHSICDYVVFTQHKNKIFCLCIELKSGKQQTSPQLKAGNCLAHFIVSTINRINKVSLNVEFRFVSIHDKNIVRKGTTRCNPVVYDGNGFIDFKGSSFILLEFLS